MGTETQRRRIIKAKDSPVAPVEKDSKIKILLSPGFSLKNDSSRCSTNIDDE